MTYINNMTAEWADAAINFNAVKMDVTDTSSGNASNLLNLLLDGTSKFSVSKTGDALVNGITVGKGGSSGSGNSVFGLLAFSGAATASYNTVMGKGALQSVDTNANCAFGYTAGQVITTGSWNNIFGAYAGLSLTTGSTNAFFGRAAGGLSTTASGSVAMGESALYSATTNPGTAVGYQALMNATGAGNTGVGYRAGDLITSGQNNTIFGHGADVAAATDNNSVVIGQGAVGQGTNKAVWGNTSITDHYFSGTMHFGTFTSSADTAVNGYITITDAGGTTRKLATIA